MKFARRVQRLETIAAAVPRRECRCVPPRFARVPADGPRRAERCGRCGLVRPVIWIRHAPDWLMPGGPPDDPSAPVVPFEKWVLFVLDDPDAVPEWR